ncbi:hypothetical protein AN8106.2 [Aspergillus nidulans FGSC A4]|uniref:Phytanoyl-CoA dioxygenase family protein n=1 Tax=Emericella nidulans (strain FGSC A4 / ATCC 38163 / CBS 112.46 / NRRL 194 / M139) TaxID=227321 RepID=Q5AUC4_EMENI|nr:hypothetical protein [Aspergillus nidulans FGSC A4]EAA59728.1 hypothetical protein AN8106.2 [Aspergillus nidulans FGSC A4]CBF73898.1 TPA: conserved hypothetical protein [Aspergillus nidulans FGSC A4]|eukprot:XP_681375.1 hypothetical protein AN8106.2 [Aspergillus nidulans FGSC A4]
MHVSRDYAPGLQYVLPSAPVDDIFYLLKRDGAVVIRNLISHEDLDQTYEEIEDTLNADLEWDGEFFPKETKRANGLIGISPTYVRTQLMHPLFQATSAHFLTTRSTYWWGNKRKESVSRPYVQAALAIQVGPGAKAQPLHCDSYINHRVVDEIAEWNDERDANRETSLGMSSCPDTPPPESAIIVPRLSKGDAFMMLSSLRHGGGNNTTSDQHRLIYCSFATRGFLRQEENQYLAVPGDVVKSYDRATQQFIGYYISEPACGQVNQRDPIYVLYPEDAAKPSDF